MKKLLAVIFLSSALTLTVSANTRDFRAVWVTTVYNLDFPSKPGLPASQIKAEADAIIENAHAWGLNAIFLQVRPSSDAFYPSEIFPWSAYLSGEQGVAPDGDFDPLGYFIERAHGLEIEVHAWVNPYRITRASKPTREEAFALLSENHPARSMEQAVVFHTDGCLYFDPGRPESRALITAGIMEIAENYAVDGIHMDDYFYPGASFADGETFALYGEGFTNIGDFRRASVTQLIEMVSAGLKALPRFVDFGISPFGIWANDSQHPEGSATGGDSSYFSHFADTRGWVKDEIIDYIMPQLYWQIGHESADFITLLNWWDDVVRGTDVELYIGLAAYRLLEAAPGSPWESVDEISRQLDAVYSSSASGFGLYRYQSIVDNPALAELLSGFFAAPAERFYMNYPPIAHSAGAKIDDGPVRANHPFAVGATAPLGASVGIFLGGEYTGFDEKPGGVFSGRPQMKEGVRFPLLVSEQNGFVRVEIIPQKIAAVEADAEVSITKISTSNAENAHRVTFETGTPAAAKITRIGSVVKLEIAPCRMGVLFEDEFFESISFARAGDAGVYTLILPVSAGGFDCSLEWDERSVSLIVTRRN